MGAELPWLGWGGAGTIQLSVGLLLGLVAMLFVDARRFADAAPASTS